MDEFLDVLSPYDFLVRESLILLLVALSVYLLLRAGMFALPQVGFMGVGGYVAAIASEQFDVPLLGRLVAAALVSGLVGLLLGLVLARLQGIYLAIATIGFSEIVRLTARNLDITGGAVGLIGLDRTLSDVYVVVLVVAVLAIMGRLAYTRFGLGMTAMREDALTASHQGVSLRHYRAWLFTASGFVAGLAGGLHIHLRGFIEPSLFSFELLTTLVTATVVGGMMSILGPVLGGLLVFSLPEILRAVDEYRTLVNGALLVIVLAFLPAGLVDLPRRLVSAVRRRRRLERSADSSARDPDDGVSQEHPTALSESGTRDQSETTQLRGDRTAQAATPVLEVTGVSQQFGGLCALNSVDLTVHRGEVFGVIGPNGSGKTTLLNVLSGVHRPSAGEGTVMAAPLERMWGRPALLARAGVARTFQTIRLLDDHSVRENVELGAYLLQHASLPAALLAMPASRAERRAVDERVSETLESVGIGDLSDQQAGALPYGLQRRVELARALVRRPALLLLDEPTAGMTPGEREDIFRLLDDVRAQDIGVIVVEHDVKSMTAHCDRLAVLNFGDVISLGDPEVVMREEVVVDAYVGRRS